MARNPRSISSELQAANDAFGKAFCNWRTRNGLSQQDPHNWAKDRKSKGPFNSQVAYLEAGNLDPKAQFWLSLADFNMEIATQGEKGFRYVVSGARDKKESTRERLQKAAPFLNYQEEVATAGDFFEMFIGEQMILDLYMQKYEPLTEEFCNQYGKTLEKAFNDIARELMLSKKEAWQGLKETIDFPQSDEEYLHVCQDLLRGEHDLTKEETVAIAGAYKRCPCKEGLVELAGRPIDYLEEATKELFAKL